MLRLVLILGAICRAMSSGAGIAHVGGFSPAIPVGPVANGPVVTAASSQYFERTFNRLIAPPPLQPVLPVAPPPPPIFIQPSLNPLPVASAPPQRLPVPPQVIPSPPQLIPVQPQTDSTQGNVAVAVATAHAAAPVATILLPPYPFGPPPVFGFVPASPPANIPEQQPREQTTPSTTTIAQVEVTTTEREPETTTPQSSNSDDQFVQALPSNENVNFNQVYGPPPQRPWLLRRPQETPLLSRPSFPQQAQLVPNGPPPQVPNVLLQGNPLPPNHHQQQWSQKPVVPHNYWPLKERPQKLKTSVEVVKVPLAYIAPPPPHTHEHVKVIKHVYGFAPPTKSKIIIRTIRTPGHIVTYRIPVSTKSIRPYGIRPKDIELTTHRAVHNANYS